MGKYRRFAVTFKVTVVTFGTDEKEVVERAREKIDAMVCPTGYEAKDTTEPGVAYDPSYVASTELYGVNVGEKGKNEPLQPEGPVDAEDDRSLEAWGRVILKKR